MEKIHDNKNLLNYRRRLKKNLTPQEVILWSRLKNKQLGYKFRRQHSINNYIVDFYCPRKKLIVELDGWQHKREKDKKYDRKRSECFNDLEFRTLRFWNNEVNENLDGVILEIEKYLE